MSFARRGKTLPIYTTPTLPPDSRALPPDSRALPPDSRAVARTAPIGPGSILIRLNTSQALFCRNAGCKLPGGSLPSPFYYSYPPYVWLKSARRLVLSVTGTAAVSAYERTAARMLIARGSQAALNSLGVWCVSPLSTLKVFWFRRFFFSSEKLCFVKQWAQMGPRVLRENGNPPSL